MLRRLDRYADVNERKLMDLYAEGNRENAEDFFPGEDPKMAVPKAEAGFLSFLKDEFFPAPENTYWVLELDGVWVSALRLTELNGRRFYLEALETHPDYRRQGYAVRLIRAVVGELQKSGPFCICDCVGKRNAASLAAHKRAGFAIVSEHGYDWLQKEADDRHYGLELRSSEQ